jgi:hypothetical protein
MALAELVATCGASDTTAPLLDAAGVPAVARGTIAPRDWDDWRDRVGREAHRGYAWKAAIRRAPLWRKPQLALRALTYDPEAAMSGRPQPRGWAVIPLLARRFALTVWVTLRRHP